MVGEARRKQGEGKDSSSKETKVVQGSMNVTNMESENWRTYAFAAIERQVKVNLMRDILGPFLEYQWA